MNTDQTTHKDLLRIINEAIGHPEIQPVDFGLSGRVLIDHIIGRFEEAIGNIGGYESCPEKIRAGYSALRQLYPLYFQNHIKICFFQSK
mgnify:FL=1